MIWRGGYIYLAGQIRFLGLDFDTCAVKSGFFLSFWNDLLCLNVVIY